MIPLHPDTIDYLLFLMVALRQHIEDLPPDESKAFTARLELLGAYPINISTLRAIEASLALAEPIPLINEDD